jgi:hypothetical protein
VIAYAWGPPVAANQRLNGLRLQTVATSSQRICQYACERSQYCAGYNFQTAYGFSLPFCEHFSIIDSTTPMALVSSSRR